MKDLIHVIGLIARRTGRYCNVTLMLTGMMAVTNPIGFMIGLGIFLWLGNTFAWYFDLWMYSYIVFWVIYLVSETYRSWAEIALGWYLSIIEAKYP